VTVCVLTACGTANAQGRQPISTSLVECAAIYAELATLAERRGRDETDIGHATDMSVRFAEAALRQAGGEGRSDPQAHLSTIFSEMERKWNGRFSNPMKLSENKDWIDYCRALGRDRGILARPN